MAKINYNNILKMIHKETTKHYRIDHKEIIEHIFRTYNRNYEEIHKEVPWETLFYNILVSEDMPEYFYTFRRFYQQQERLSIQHEFFELIHDIYNMNVDIDFLLHVWHCDVEKRFIPSGYLEHIRIVQKLSGMLNGFKVYHYLKNQLLTTVDRYELQPELDMILNIVDFEQHF